MTSQTDRSSARAAVGNLAILDAARAVIAQRGLAGMSLRTVAEHAGISVGSISYRIGDRAALVMALVDREIEIIAALSEDWQARLGGIDPIAAGILPDLICEWLDLPTRRTSAIVVCELALMASRDPQALPGLESLFDASEAFWRDLLGTTPGGRTLAKRVASYCIDEQSFSLLLSANADYRLLRQSTVRGLLRDDGILVRQDWTDWHMLLVDRLAEPAAAALDKAADIPEGIKATIADQIADMIIAQGVGALSHRGVAEALTMATSSVAHHYPAQRDILFAGVEAIYRRMRATIEASNGAAPGGGEITRLTHETALMAIRNPAFLPFAIDMRRRRAENVHVQVAQGLDIPPDSDRPRTQAMVMALMGNSLRMMASGATPLPAPEVVKMLADSRTYVFY